MKNFILVLVALGGVVGAYFLAGSWWLSDNGETVKEETVTSGEDRLASSSWSWVRTELLNGEEIVAPADMFILSFHSEGRVTSTTDCNSISGVYMEDHEVLSLGQFSMTKMFCANSLESKYVEQLGLVNSFVTEGETLQLNLNRDYGVMIFSKYNE